MIKKISCLVLVINALSCQACMYRPLTTEQSRVAQEISRECEIPDALKKVQQLDEKVYDNKITIDDNFISSIKEDFKEAITETVNAQKAAEEYIKGKSCDVAVLMDLESNIVWCNSTLSNIYTIIRDALDIEESELRRKLELTGKLEEDAESIGILDEMDQTAK